MTPTETPNGPHPDRLSMQESAETLREAIELTVYRNPEATYEEIAEELDTSSTWVGKVVNDSQEATEVREAFGDDGIEIPATSGRTESIAEAVESLHPTLAKRIREGRSLGDIESIELRLNMATDETDDD